MKSLIVVVAVFKMIYLSSIYQVSRAQDFENPQAFFQKFEFDRTVMGGFNLSICLTDLLTCFETVKPDVICTQNWKQYESVCSPMNEGCDDDVGYDNYMSWYRDALFENVCTYSYYQFYT